MTEHLQFVPEGAPVVFTAASPALSLHVHAVVGRARACTLHLKHGPIRTPVFMPVGTKGTIKAMTTDQLLAQESQDLAPEIILGNTYHLASQPGTELLAEFGGLHNFMQWPRNLLTDSGGFQMVSLLKLAHITEEGVRFTHPTTHEQLLLTPEESIRCQNNIGSDIMMQLDDVISSTTVDNARFEEAMHRSVRWLDRCMAAHTRPNDQALFGIIQGGLDVSAGGLREQCAKAMTQRNLPGYAIGGLAGGEDKASFWRVVAHNTALLPANKPRYVMGVGYPLDLVICSLLGADMFDCVYPTRIARFGVALIPTGTLRLKGKDCGQDLTPLDLNCKCVCCHESTRVSKAALHAMVKDGSPLACQLLTAHNISYLLTLMRSLRVSIMQGPAALRLFVVSFLQGLYPNGDLPLWVQEALVVAELGDILPLPSVGSIDRKRSVVNSS